MQIIYDTSEVELRSSEELVADCFKWSRKPLIARFREKRTGKEFLFSVNHLARGDEEKRLAQARFLHAWVVQQRLPVVLVGDFNFDFYIPRPKMLQQPGVDGHGNAAFAAFTETGEIEWVKPARLVKTQGDDEYRSVLDFIFIYQKEKFPITDSVILLRESDGPAIEFDFSDTTLDSDHRPVDALVRL